MGKRFTATEKWDKEWFMKLPPKLKCLWQYINDRCNQAGVWEENFSLASLHIGEPISLDDLKVFGKRLELIEVGKWWIVDHVDFQTGGLSEKSPAHKPIFKILKKYNLLNRVLGRVSNTLQEKEIEKEEEPDGEEEKETPKTKEEISKELFSDEIYVSDLNSAHKGKDIVQAFNECYTHHANSPSPPQELWEWRQKLNTWLTIKGEVKIKTNGKSGKRSADAVIQQGKAFGSFD